MYTTLYSQCEKYKSGLQQEIEMCNIGFVIDLTRLTGGDWCSAADASSAAATAARYSLSSASDMERLEARLG